MSGSYNIIDHSADIGLEIEADTVESLFESAAVGMISIIADSNEVKSDAHFDIILSEATYEDLLVEWLKELLFIFASNNYILNKFKIKVEETDSERKSLTAKCYGELFNPEKHPLKTEIKNVTYHKLNVSHSSSKWKGTVIFDL